jgi:hypothetical protein
MPLLIWTNRDNPETGEMIRNIGTVTPQMLANEIFNITGMPKPAYMQMLENIKQTTRGFTSRYMLDENGNHSETNDFKYFEYYEYAEDFEKIKNIHDKMRVVQYDATIGRNYFIDEFAEFAKSANP